MTDVSRVIAPHQPPTEWLNAATRAAKSLRALTRWEAREWARAANGRNTTRSVYAILLHDPDYEHPFGIYVGYTHHPPSQRYAEHRRGEGFSDVQKYHVRLLPELYRHLNPMKPAEAKQMEKALFAVLREAGIRWVSMGNRRPGVRKNEKN